MEREPLSLKEFSAVLTDEIENSELTAQEVFERVGIPPVYLSQWRRDKKRAPYYYEVAKFAEILNRPIEMFIYGKIDRPYARIPLGKLNNYKKVLESLLNEVNKDLNRNVV